MEFIEVRGIVLTWNSYGSASAYIVPCIVPTESIITIDGEIRDANPAYNHLRPGCTIHLHGGLHIYTQENYETIRSMLVER